MRRAALLVLAGLAGTAVGDPIDDHVANGKALFAKGDYLHARDELHAAFDIEPRPELLFALGQCELNLEHFAVAIDYYEKFIATNPGDDQVALAQQAIGAARGRIAEAKRQSERPLPKPHVLRRQWDSEDTGLTVVGGAGVVLGVGLVLYGKHLGDDRSGRLSSYDSRYSQARISQYAGIGCVVAGALSFGFAMYRWRYHLIDTEVEPVVAPKAAGVNVVMRW